VAEDLLRLGMMVNTPMGSTSLTYADINEWAKALQIEVTGTQAETMVMMSEHYTHEFKIASNTKGSHTRPYRVSTDKEDVSNRLKTFFRSSKKVKNNG
jgi:hypothetical protein